MITLTILANTINRIITPIITVLVRRRITRILLVINIIDNSPLHIRDSMTKLTILTIAKETIVALLMILILAITVLIGRAIANLEMRTVGVILVVSHHCL